MSNDNLDRLFEQKLSGHKVAPSVAAWDKLESRLQKKRKPFWLWSRIAAALLLIAVCGWLVISLVNNKTLGPDELAVQDQTGQQSDPEASAVENAVTSKQKDTADEKVEQNVAQILETIDNNTQSAPLANDTEISLSNKSQPATEDYIQNQLLAEQTPELEVKKTTDNNPEVTLAQEQKEMLLTSPESTTAVTEADNSTISQQEMTLEETTLAKADVIENSASENVRPEEIKRAPIKIIYKRSSEANEGALLANNNDGKETKGIQKMWQKAKNIKNNELSIGKLRAAKDELLAFRGDKNKQSKSN